MLERKYGGYRPCRRSDLDGRSNQAIQSHGEWYRGVRGLDVAKNTGRQKVKDEETIWNQEVWLASVGLLYWKYLVSTFVTTKFNHVAGRMVVQHPALTWQGS